jgi:hypothetical protein
MPPALFVSLVLVVAAAKKEAKNEVLVVGTQQNLSNLDFIYISMGILKSAISDFREEDPQFFN